MKAMILAAGLGTRLRPLTDERAKPAVPFLNVPLLYYPLHMLRDAGIDLLVLNTHHKPEQIEKLAFALPNLNSAFSHEKGAPLGSGGGIWKARGFLEGDGSFLVSNGDEVILPQDPAIMQKFVDLHVSTKSLATILTMRHPLVGTQFGGVWADAKNEVKGFGKDRAKFGPWLTGYHYIGLLLLSDRVFKYLPEGESNILYDALARGIADGEVVRTLVADFTWFETGNAKDFLEASGEALRLLFDGKGEDSRTLANICREHWSEGTRIEKRDGALVLRGSRSTIADDAKLEGFVVLGDDTVIEAGTRVRDCVLLPDARVAAHHSVENEIIYTV